MMNTELKIKAGYHFFISFHEPTFTCHKKIFIHFVVYKILFYDLILSQNKQTKKH